MKIIEYITDQACEELEDSLEYVEHALHYREEHRALANLLFDLSKQEYSHFQMLHEQSGKIIEEWKREHGEAPEGMKWMWEREHKRQIEKATKIKMLHEMYKDG